MSLLSDRVQKTNQVVVLPSSLEDPNRTIPGLYKVGLIAICVAIFVFFFSLALAYYWRSAHPPFWAPIQLPGTLWLSTAIILMSSVTFEIGRHLFRRGSWRAANRLFILTTCFGAAFVASQITAWRQLVAQGAFLWQNPHSSFFYLFTGLHAAHLLGGLVALFVLILGASRRRELVDVTCYYWHFLGALWLALFYILKTR